MCGRRRGGGISSSSSSPSGSIIKSTWAVSFSFPTFAKEKNPPRCGRKLNFSTISTFLPHNSVQEKGKGNSPKSYWNGKPRSVGHPGSAGATEGDGQKKKIHSRKDKNRLCSKTCGGENRTRNFFEVEKDPDEKFGKRNLVRDWQIPPRREKSDQGLTDSTPKRIMSGKKSLTKK